MENQDDIKEFIGGHPHKNKVHKVLAHSYSVYLFFLLLSICLDLLFSIRIFNSSIHLSFGLMFLVFGTFLVVWAQYTSRNIDKVNITKETFMHGPYRFTRMPTNYGLLFLTLGFGIITNAFFVVLFSFLSLIIAKFIFIQKQEEILSEKYGEPYQEYKKIVKF